MLATADAIASTLATARDLARTEPNNTAAASASQFAAVLADNALAAAPDTQANATTTGRSAAWEDFYSHPVIGTSEDGLPIVGETEAELANTQAVYAKMATAHGLDPQPTATLQARMPVTDGLLGPKLGYHQMTALALPVALTQASLHSAPSWLPSEAEA
ncbi:hypothetical protein [Desulfovibrio sp. TomC]|uniref:hypothetical protein n=1 Tax=Desulfovibrio sp. TomC TaxID=1562888 RepID=UPI000575593A|nr:hypothetical protein [Desulfovibrio sp. TomC]KHK02752.1 hypothetical protein NY78_1702 [Desulfovibrio sp. TomC]